MRDLLCRACSAAGVAAASVARLLVQAVGVHDRGSAAADGPLGRVKDVEAHDPTARSIRRGN